MSALFSSLLRAAASYKAHSPLHPRIFSRTIRIAASPRTFAMSDAAQDTQAVDTVEEKQTNEDVVEDPKVLARWGRLGTSMEYFHNYFKAEFNQIYELADGSFADRRMTLQAYLREIETWKRHLETHHSIEERFIFPILAKRMPAFADNEQHRKSHEGIHAGLDRLGDLSKTWKASPTTFSPTELRECLDSFKDVLMRHLDEEVNDLQAENMKKYWKLEEVDRIAM